MAGTIIDGAHLQGITLNDPKTENPAIIAVGGYVTNEGSANNGTALLGTVAAAWTITNLGQINGKSGSASDGIRLLAGGFVTNGASGSAAGLVTANLYGIEIDGKRGTVVIHGAILGLGRNGEGVALKARGAVVSDGLIEGTANGVAIGGGAGPSPMPARSSALRATVSSSAAAAPSPTTARSKASPPAPTSAARPAPSRIPA